MTLENALKMLELDPKNVVGILLQCKPTPETKRVIKANFYGKYSKQQAPEYPLDDDKVLQYCPLIRYWLGQLQFVQQKKESVSPAMGLVNYQGKRWTEDNRALFALYYLATSSLQLPYFMDRELPSVRVYYSRLPATYMPSDPNFKITEPVEKALFCLGCFDTQKETIAAAKRGNADAQYKLAKMLYHWAAPAYKAQAFEWYERAAKQGNIDAMLDLGLWFEREKPVREQKWNLKAAELGNAKAQERVGYAYHKEKDMSQAIYWYEKAAAQGNTGALGDLRDIYMSGKDGVPRNSAAAARWAVKLCEIEPTNGNRSKLGELANEARDLFTSKSYCLGYSIAYPIAEYAYCKQDKHFALMCSFVGYAHAYGHGAAKDRYEAKKWLKRAVNMGEEHARKLLNDL